MRESILGYFYDSASREEDIAFSHRPRLRRKSWTYAEIAQVSFQFARELESRGIDKGDRVIIWAENSPEWVSAFWGIILRGAIAVPLDEQSAPDFISRISEQTRPKLLLYGTNIDCSHLQYPKIALQDLPDAVSHRSQEKYERKNVSPDETVEIVFTSGTTATPKGVVLTHENLLANLAPMQREISKYIRWKFLVDPVRILCLLPLSHVFGQMMGIFIPQILGAEVLFQNRFNPSEIVDTIKHERVMVLAAVPRVLETLQHKIERDYEENGKPDKLRRSSAMERSWVSAWWKYRSIHRMFGYKFLSFVTGGASLDESTESFWRRLGFAVAQGYGMTETAALVSLNNPFSSRRGSIGQILAGRENIRIGENGEILVRGKNISPGYWGEKRREDEWLDTGDIGSMDETGRLYFKGREKDVIVTAAGLNIYPEDLESALNAQAETIASAVVAIENANGPEPVAALILRPGASAANIVGEANKSLAPFQQIRRWIEWPEPDFPRTSTQKVRKNLVAEAVKQRLISDGPSDALASPLSNLLARLGNRNKVNSKSRLDEDLNLDSLSRVELMSAIEDRYQIDLDEQSFTESATVGDLEKMIRVGYEPKAERIRFEYPYWTLRFPITWLRRVFYPLVIYPITRILCWVNTRGLENLTNIKGPVVFASNHVTYVDPALIISAMPWRFQQHLAIAMDGERQYHYRHPLPGTSLLMRLRGFFTYWLVITFFGAFPLPRRSGFRKSFEFAGEAMDRGNSILIFPEGELTEDGSIQKFKTGVGLLANGLEAPIVPVSITGLYELRHAGQRGWAPPGRVTITFGEPIPYNPTAEAAEIVGELEDRVKGLQ